MLYVSLIFESARAHPRLMFWTAALAQAFLWFAVPTMFYATPPGDLPLVLAIGHEYQLGTDLGPPLAFWLADIAFKLSRGTFGVYLLAQVCVVLTLWAIFELGRAVVGIFHAVLAVLLMVGIGALTVPTPEFGPAVLAMPIWAFILLHYWRAVGEGRSEYWILLGIEMGLLLLTSVLGFILFALLALFTAVTPHGRKTLRKIDPWLCAAVAILIALPYIAWLSTAQDIWKPLVARLPQVQPAQVGRDWLHILSTLAVAHAGVIIFVILASGIGLRKQRVATLDRAPMLPLARSLVYFFALAPMLLVTLVLGIATQPWSLASAGPLVVCSGLAVIVAAGDSISLYRQRLLGMAWVGLLIGPPAAIVTALLVLPWTLAIDFKVLQPAREMGRFFAESFERRTSKPLRIVAGDRELAALVALEARVRPSLLIEAAPQRTPWVTLADARKHGAVVVWPAVDRAGTPPPSIKASFPDLVVELPRAFERRVEGRLPSLRIGWGVLRPQADTPATAP